MCIRDRISHRSAKIHDRQSSAMVTSGKKISQAWIAFKSQCFLHFAAPLPQTWLGWSVSINNASTPCFRCGAMGLSVNFPPWMRRLTRWNSRWIEPQINLTDPRLRGLAVELVLAWDDVVWSSRKHRRFSQSSSNCCPQRWPIEWWFVHSWQVFVLPILAYCFVHLTPYPPIHCMSRLHTHRRAQSNWT